MPKTKKLKPCKKCNQHRIDVCKVQETYIKCRGCGYTTFVCENETDAIDIWNRRENANRKQSRKP